MNQKLKHHYFNNTNHGGCGGNKSGAMISGDHCRLLIRMCQRFVVWKLGIGDDFFMSKGIALKTTDALIEDDVIEEDGLECGYLQSHCSR